MTEVKNVVNILLIVELLIWLLNQLLISWKCDQYDYFLDSVNIKGTLSFSMSSQNPLWQIEFFPLIWMDSLIIMMYFLFFQFSIEVSNLFTHENRQLSVSTPRSLWL